MGMKGLQFEVRYREGADWHPIAYCASREAAVVVAEALHVARGWEMEV